GDLVVAQAELAGSGILVHVLRAGGLRDREQRRTPDQEAERHLAWRGAVRDGDLVQDAPSARARTREARVAERTVADDRDAVSLAPRDYGMLDRALVQVVEDLVADRAAVAGQAPCFLEVGDVEVADTPGQDLACAPQLLECRDRVLEGMPPAPVQEVRVQPIGSETSERPLARLDRPVPGRMLGKDLGHQEDLVPTASDRLP